MKANNSYIEKPEANIGGKNYKYKENNPTYTGEPINKQLINDPSNNRGSQIFFVFCFLLDLV